MPVRHVLPTVGSTMDAAHRLAQEGAAHGTAVIALEQTGGRGQRGRAWAAAPGGLWLSVVGRPTRDDGLSALSLQVGLGVAAALESVVPMLPMVRIKWPNDLLLDDRKVGGILTEARWSEGQCLWVVVGIGINVANALPDALAGQATRLAEYAPGIEPGVLADPVITAIVRAMDGEGVLDERARTAFARRDALAGCAVEAPIAGIACGVTAAGALRVRAADGTIHSCVAGVVPVST